MPRRAPRGAHAAGASGSVRHQRDVGGGDAQSVSNGLVQKLGGASAASNDGGFKAGSAGTLQTGQGQGFSLSGSGLKQQLTEKVCDMVLQHGKSLL